MALHGITHNVQVQQQLFRSKMQAHLTSGVAALTTARIDAAVAMLASTTGGPWCSWAGETAQIPLLSACASLHLPLTVLRCLLEVTARSHKLFGEASKARMHATRAQKQSNQQTFVSSMKARFHALCTKRHNGPKRVGSRNTYKVASSLLSLA